MDDHMHAPADCLGRAQSLLELSAALDEAQEELDIAAHVSLLRRRFVQPEEQVVLAAGTAAGEALLADRRAQIGRLQHDEEMCDLRAALAEANAELQRERARAETLDNQLQLVAHQSDDRRQVRPTEASDGTIPQSSALTAPAPPALATATRAAADTSAIPMELSPRGLIDELQRARLEAVSGAGGAALKALVSRALSALSRDLYSGAGAVLAELIQNADDARYPLDTLPTLRISVTHGGGPSRPLGLMIEANECGFSEADVRAICDLGASAKVRDGEAAATGRKGLGFKSVRAKPNDAKTHPRPLMPTRLEPVRVFLAKIAGLRRVRHALSALDGLFVALRR